MSAKRGTYLITFVDGTQIVCGNNYKDWWLYAWGHYQATRPHRELVALVEFSDTPFVDDGGLKYATPIAYDEIINEENAKDGGGRIPFKHINFYRSNADKKKLDDSLKYWGLTYLHAPSSQAREK